ASHTSCTSPVWPTSNAPPSSRSATPTPPDRGGRGRQTTHPRRAGGRAPQGDYPRGRGGGVATKAHGRRPGHPAIGADRPHGGVLRGSRRRAAVRGGQGGQGGVLVRH